jgi:hypothetical protein
LRPRSGSRKTYHGDADYFGVYCPELGTSYLVPVEDVGNVEGALRVEPTRNGQLTGVRWAKNYELT